MSSLFPMDLIFLPAMYRQEGFSISSKRSVVGGNLNNLQEKKESRDDVVSFGSRPRTKQGRVTVAAK